MISTWRNRRAARRAVKNQSPDSDTMTMEVTVPTHFRCPISLDLMKDPVTLSTGMTYDRESIETWIEAGNFTCPVTNQALQSVEQIPNHTIRRMIQDWCVENRSYGIERIPTPRIPVSPFQISQMLNKISTAIRREDQIGCRELVVKIKNLGKESERNKRCIISNGTGSVLSAAFDKFARKSFEKQSGVLEEILSVLSWMTPFNAETQSYLGSKSSLHFLVWCSKNGDLSGRGNAVLVLKELLSLDQRHVNSLGEIEGLMEALVMLIKEPICPKATKDALMVIYYLVSSSSNSRIKLGFVEMGLVDLLLEILVDSEKSICEKALGILDGICSDEEGREKAYNHSLSMPILVKKILRVSELATEFSISILWKLCKNEKRKEGGVLVEALQVGVFQKLLLLLQVGCGEKTKEKGTEVLKLLNLYRAKLECIDSMDFKNLRRPF